MRKLTKFVNLFINVESKETTWEYGVKLCEPETWILPDVFPEVLPPDFWTPLFNFSLIVDPNNPLFEDEIKASVIIQYLVFN